MEFISSSYKSEYISNFNVYEYPTGIGHNKSILMRDLHLYDTIQKIKADTTGEYAPLKYPVLGLSLRERIYTNILNNTIYVYMMHLYEHRNDNDVTLRNYLIRYLNGFWIFKTPYQPWSWIDTKEVQNNA